MCDLHTHQLSLDKIGPIIHNSIDNSGLDLSLLIAIDCYFLPFCCQVLVACVGRFCQSINTNKLLRALDVTFFFNIYTVR